ncbi:MAG: MFS transporter [Oceanidesulfovibrio sp.]
MLVRRAGLRGNAFPMARRGWAMGVVISGFAFGQVAGLPVATWLAGAAGYKAPFMAFGALMAACAVCVWLFAPQPEHIVPKRRALSELLADYHRIASSRDLCTALVVGVLVLSGMSVY